MRTLPYPSTVPGDAQVRGDEGVRPAVFLDKVFVEGGRGESPRVRRKLSRMIPGTLMALQFAGNGAQARDS